MIDTFKQVIARPQVVACLLILTVAFWGVAFALGHFRSFDLDHLAPWAQLIFLALHVLLFMSIWFYLIDVLADWANRSLSDRTQKIMTIGLVVALLSLFPGAMLIVWYMRIPTLQQQIFAQKATGKAAACQALSDKQIRGPGPVIVWDLENRSFNQAQFRLHSQDLVGRPTSKSEWPVTVFLVGAERRERVGQYTDGTPADRISLDVCVVQFSSLDDDGTAVADHKVSADPPPIIRRPKGSDNFQHHDSVADELTLSNMLSDWVNSSQAN